MCKMHRTGQQNYSMWMPMEMQCQVLLCLSSPSVEAVDLIDFELKHRPILQWRHPFPEHLSMVTILVQVEALIKNPPKWFEDFREGAELQMRIQASRQT